MVNEDWRQRGRVWARGVSADVMEGRTMRGRVKIKAYYSKASLSRFKALVVRPHTTTTTTTSLTP